MRYTLLIYQNSEAWNGGPATSSPRPRRRDIEFCIGTVGPPAMMHSSGRQPIGPDVPAHGDCFHDVCLSVAGRLGAWRLSDAPELGWGRVVGSRL